MKLKEEKGMIGGQEMANLGKLLPEIAKSTPSYLDLADSNLEAISVLGEHSALLINVFLEENARINLNTIELKSLGRMVCGLTGDQWTSLINKKVLNEVLVPHISSLECELTTQVQQELYIVSLFFYFFSGFVKSSGIHFYFTIRYCRF